MNGCGGDYAMSSRLLMGDQKFDVILLLLFDRKCPECRACVVRSVREEQGLTIDLEWLYLTGGSRYVLCWKKPRLL